MIFHLATEENSWPPAAFFETWGRELAARFQTGLVHQLAIVHELPVGTYLFCDLEIMTPHQKALLRQVWQQLANHGRSRLLNDPAKVKGRFELLQALYEIGRNDFRAFRADALPRDIRFPVFVRYANDHRGSRTPLLSDWAELDSWILRALLGGAEPDHLMVTEFTETRGPDGLYRKFGAFRVGDRIIARQIHFGKEWMVKSPDRISPEGIEEERQYMLGNSFEDQIREVFELACIDYGRMDFSFGPSGMQVWEINTNPVITHPREQYDPAHIPAQDRFSRQMVDALKAIDSAASGIVPLRLKSPIPIPIET